jgi:hypothetical protein
MRMQMNKSPIEWEKFMKLITTKKKNSTVASSAADDECDDIAMTILNGL